MLIVFLFTEFSTLVAIRLVLLYDRSSSDARAINFNFDIHSLAVTNQVIIMFGIRIIEWKLILCMSYIVYCMHIFK